jgi:hypothetical protein
MYSSNLHTASFVRVIKTRSTTADDSKWRDDARHEPTELRDLFSVPIHQNSPMAANQTHRESGNVSASSSGTKLVPYDILIGSGIFACSAISISFHEARRVVI